MGEEEDREVLMGTSGTEVEEVEQGGQQARECQVKGLLLL